MREIVFDTETTGFDPAEHRILEIGAVELINHLPTGRTFHHYLNPERDIDAGAERVHGISLEKVKDKPKFAEIMQEMLDFFGSDAILIAHNAAFDRSFVNMELGRCGHPGYANSRFLDTLELAKQKLPGQRHNLDALCRTYNIDTSARTFHGALLDAQLLADVYIELTGGLQTSFLSELPRSHSATPSAQPGTSHAPCSLPAAPGKVLTATPAEHARHVAFLAKLVPGSSWPNP